MSDEENSIGYIVKKGKEMQDKKTGYKMQGARCELRNKMQNIRCGLKIKEILNCQYIFPVVIGNVIFHHKVIVRTRYNCSSFDL